jgi:hypothetical protein
LVEANAERLPLAESSVDIVTASICFMSCQRARVPPPPNSPACSNPAAG